MRRPSFPWLPITCALLLGACGASQPAASPTGQPTATGAAPTPTATATASQCTSTRGTTATTPTLGTTAGTLATGRILFAIEGLGTGSFSLATIDSSGFHATPISDWTFARATWATADQIVFDSERAGDRHLFEMSMATGSVNQLTDGVLTAQESASVSVSANRLVFTDYSCSQPLDLGLHVAKADGSDPVGLTPARAVGDLGDDEQASLAPDGRSVVFVRVTRGATGGLFIADAASGAVRRLTPDWGDVGHPRWSPDGRSILFTQDSPQGDQAVYVVAATGGEPRALTHFPAGDLAFQADWSPDGSQIVFVYWDRQDHNALWVMAADGSQQQALWVGDHSEADWPDWGP